MFYSDTKLHICDVISKKSYCSNTHCGSLLLKKSLILNKTYINLPHIWMQSTIQTGTFPEQTL